MSKRLPPSVLPVFRLGSSQFMAGQRRENRSVNQEGWPQPLGLFNPEDVVDLKHGTALSLLEAQLALMHGANFNDPARWKSRTAGVSTSAVGSLVPLASYWFSRW